MERELEYWAPGATEPRVIRVSISNPVQASPMASGADWSCSLTIAGFDEEPYSRTFTQVDAIGAMLSALGIAPYLLRTFVRRGGRLTYLQSEDLSFPLLSPPSQDWQFLPTAGGTPRKISVRVGHPERTGASWSVLVILTDFGRDDEDDDYISLEERIHGPTWANALELAAAAVPVLLQKHVDNAGGGTLEEADDSPACPISGE